MSSCSIPGCTYNRRFKPEGISFYTFPRGAERLKSWLKVCGIDENTWTWSKNKVICSRHFRPEDIVKGSKIYLKADAVPINMNISETNVSLNTTLTVSSVIETSSSTESGERTLLKRKLSPKKVAASVTTETGRKQDTSSSTETSVQHSDSSGTKYKYIF